MVKASECRCVVCGRKAVAFWPLVDPDIRAEPFCRRCLDKAKVEFLMGAFGYGRRDAGRLARMREVKDKEDDTTDE